MNLISHQLGNDFLNVVVGCRSVGRVACKEVKSVCSWERGSGTWKGALETKVHEDDSFRRH